MRASSANSIRPGIGPTIYATGKMCLATLVGGAKRHVVEILIAGPLSRCGPDQMAHTRLRSPAEAATGIQSPMSDGRIGSLIRASRRIVGIKSVSPAVQ